VKFEYSGEWGSHNTSLVERQLLQLSRRSTTIYWGFPKGNGYSDIAKTLSEGAYDPPAYKSPRGEWIKLKKIPARDFLNDGFRTFQPLIKEEIEKYWIQFFKNGIPDVDSLGQLIVDCVRAFVMDDPYTTGKHGASALPNSPVVQEDKGYPSIPLVDSGGMVDSIEFVVTNRLDKG